MRKRGNIIFGFIILILVMGLGFAYLNSGLSINGTANISNASWNVYWDSLNVTEGSVEDVTTAAHILTGETEVEFNVNFTKPGDFYEFTVDAVNDGSIDAMVDSLTKGVYAANGTTPKTLPDYLTYSVTYSDGIEIEANHLLEAGHTEKYKVRVEYKTDIEANQLPSTADNYMFKIAVNYKQADSNATPARVPTYYAFGEPTTSSTTDYTTLNKSVFVSLQGTQKSVCIIKNSELHCFKINNWDIEKYHIQEVILGTHNEVSGDSAYFDSSSFYCSVESSGTVYCYDYSNNNACQVSGFDGSVDCRT